MAEEDNGLSSQVALWSAFAARVELRFPFHIEVIVAVCEHGRHSCEPGCDRARMIVRVHVPERDTREMITVDSQRPCGPWTSDEDAIELVFDLLDVALTHEIHESVRVDGKLARDLHQRR